MMIFFNEQLLNIAVVCNSKKEEVNDKNQTKQ